MTMPNDGPVDNLIPRGSSVDGEPSPGPGLSDEELAELQRQFDRAADAYIAEWEETLRQGLGSANGGEP